MDAGTIGFCERDGSESDEAGRVNFLLVSILFTGPSIHLFLSV